MMTIGSQDKMLTKTSFDEDKVKFAAESVAKIKNVSNATSAAFGALHLEAQLDFQVLKIALKEYCFVKDTPFN